MLLSELRQQLHQQIVDHPRMLQLSQLPEDNKKSILKGWIKESLVEHQRHLSIEDHASLLDHLEHEILGLGPLESLLSDDSISDILVNGPKQIYVERQGQLVLIDKEFDHAQHLKHTIDKIISPLGRRLDESHPMVDARLKDGSRLNAILPPLAIQGPILSIRRFHHQRHQGFADLIRDKALSPAMAELCQRLVEKGANIIISGGTGSGKTTLLNILASHISQTERLITIEDAAELSIEHPHCVALETRPPNMEGLGEITGEQLLKNALRMRPNRILFGELRGREAWDLLQAMNTGHPGSMTTLHANTAEHTLLRLKQLVETYHPGLRHDLHQQLIHTIDVIIHLERDQQGHRHIQALCEIHPQRHQPLVPLFLYDEGNFIQKSERSKFLPTSQRVFL